MTTNDMTRTFPQILNLFNRSIFDNNSDLTYNSAQKTLFI